MIYLTCVVREQLDPIFSFKDERAPICIVCSVIVLMTIE